MYPSSETLSRARSTLSFLRDLGLDEALVYKKDESKHYVLPFYKWREQHRDQLRKANISICDGATKICILMGNEPDWVIKLGFKGRSDYDYCELEADNYKAAFKARFSKFFAAIFKIKDSNGTFYLQQQVECDEDSLRDSFYDYCAGSYDRDDFDDEETYDAMIDDMVEECDAAECICAFIGCNNTLIEFADEHNINDLHAGNWGYLKDGSIVMIDYSGYHG